MAVPAAKEGGGAQPRGKASGRAATGLLLQVWREKTPFLPEGPGPCSGPAARAAHSPPKRAPTRRLPRESGLQRPGQAAGPGSVAQEPLAPGSAEMGGRQERGNAVSAPGPPAPKEQVAFPGSGDRKAAATFSLGPNCENSHSPYL